MGKIINGAPPSISVTATSASNASPSTDSPNHIVVTANFSSATWNTVGTHEVFTVTGAVRVRLWQLCTQTLEDAADLATIQFGDALASDDFIGSTGAAGNGGVTLSAGQWWYDTSPEFAISTFNAVVLDMVIGNGEDIGYELAGEALTAGKIEFHCAWEPLTAGSTVVAGAGGAL